MIRLLAVLSCPALLVLAGLAGSASADPLQGAAPSQDALKKGSPPSLPQGVSREEMWWSPTAEDWKKPCLITWQRTFEDAQAISKETGKPILVCVNMDGEIASEHYAGVRYRDPEIAKLYEPYVCVIASVYRHTPRDYDDDGQRILCPRFGSVTCGEHIAIEPGLHDKYFENQRVAPRHIGVELDGKEMYDVYYAWDTDTIFNSLEDGIAGRPPPPPPPPRGDRSIYERVASRDIEDRVAVERAYREGDQAEKRALLEAALAHGEAAPVDLLRQAVRGFDEDLAKLARQALAQSSDPSAAGLINEALRVPLETAEREALVGALTRLGESSPRARTLATVHRGLGNRSSSIDVERWSQALAGGGTYALARDPAELEAKVDIRAEESLAQPADAAARLELAEATLELAVQSQKGTSATARMLESLPFEDARRAALEAEELGASGWRVNAVLALTAQQLGDLAEARSRAEAAVKDMPSDAQSWSSMAVLSLFADARWQEIRKLLIEKKPWPSEWLTDVHAAYSVLARHPYGTDAQAAMHYDIIQWLGAASQAEEILERGLERFPDSWALHERLRKRVLDEKGVDGLEQAYAERLKKGKALPNHEWFAGYAALVSAEFKKRAGNDDEALAAYDRAIAHYEQAIEANPASRPTADHYAALALAGRAWIAYERGDLERAVSELLASLARKREAAASLDGLNRSPVSTARLVIARATRDGKDELAARLQAALDLLDPELLLPPEYDRETGGPSPDARAARGRVPRENR